jgi:diketogulonate reductase-like aldo/keto reductase
MTVPQITLNGGKTIPQVGFGLWKNTDEAKFNAAFTEAVKDGYRHFDTAQIYGNEGLLGAAWKQSGLRRDELFITTKVHVAHFGKHLTPSSFEKSLTHLQTDYVDLLLLHFPVTVLRKSAWQELEKIQAAGKAVNIGVSNYTIAHLEQMQKYAKVMPAVNQVELHIFLQQPELLAYCQQHNIVVEAYSPLAHARAMDNELVLGLAKKYHKSYAQIMLRWCIQKGLVILPKSVTPSRIAENIALFDFELSDEDMQQLAGSDRNLRTCWDPTRIP